MGRFLAWAGAILATVVAVLIGLVVALVVAIAVVFDWNDVKPIASKVVSGIIGRDFAINGDAHVDLGWITRIRLNDVTIANAEWSKDPKMVEIGLLDVAINIRELLKGHIVLPSLALSEPNVVLEKNANGEPNWQFSTAAKTTAEATAPEKRTEFPVVEALTIDKGHVVYRDPTKGNNIDLKIAQLTGQEDESTQRVRFEGTGSYQNQPFALKSTSGSFDTLRNAETPYPVDLDLTIADLKAKIAGTLTEPVQMKGLDLKLDVRGENTANLFPLAGLALPPSPPYSLLGQLDHQGTEWKFSNFAGRVGDSDMRGTMSVDLGGERPRLKGDLASNKLDFKDLGPFIGAKPPGRQGQDASATPQQATAPARDRALPDKEIDLSRLRAMDADMAFQAKQIVAPGLPIDRLNAKLSLNDGTLQLQPAEAGIGKGSVQLYLSLYGSKKPVQVDIDGHLQQVDLKRLLQGSQFAQQSTGLLSGRAKLKSTGTSVADILGTATGDLFVVMSGGQVSHILIELAGLDVAQALGVAVKGDEPIPIRCVVGDLGAEQGIFKTRTMVVDTTDTVIVGDGTINMRDEKLDLKLTPYPKDFSPLSLRAPIGIQGTFKNPSFFPDPAGIGTETTVKKVLDAILTPIIGLLPPIDTGEGKDTDCRALIQQATSGQQPRKR